MQPQELVTIEEVTGAQDTKFWSSWNAFVRRFGTNPLYLGGYVEFSMRYPARGWTPTLVVMKAGEKIVGAVGLKTSGVFGARVATNLYPVVHGTDFVVDPEYEKHFVRRVLGFLLDDLRCQFLDLTLPSESLILPLLKETCLSMRLKMVSAPLKDYQVEHTVLQVEGTWDEFERMRGGNFIRHFRKIEHKLGNAGKWRVERLYLDGPNSVSRVAEVEKNSWKEQSRKERGNTKGDPNLPQLFGYWESKAQDGDMPRLWLLVLNDMPIAYAIGAQLNGVAFLCKTSYDHRYANFYPGDYVQNAAIRDQFDSKVISTVDFLTPLSYHRRWTDHRQLRERVVISRTIPVLTDIVNSLSASAKVRQVYRTVVGRTHSTPIRKEVASTP